MFKYMAAAAAALALTVTASAANALTVFSGSVASVQANGGDPGLVVHTGNYNTFNVPLEVGVVSAPVGLFSIWTNESDIGWDDFAHKNIFVELAFTSPQGPWGGDPIEGQTFGFHLILAEGGEVTWDAPEILTFGNGGQVRVTLLPASFNWGAFTGSTTPGQQYGAVVDAKFELLSESVTSAVPEPATWAMMITGFGLAGTAIRRRRTTFAVAA